MLTSRKLKALKRGDNLWMDVQEIGAKLSGHLRDYAAELSGREGLAVTRLSKKFITAREKAVQHDLKYNLKQKDYDKFYRVSMGGEND